MLCLFRLCSFTQKVTPKTKTFFLPSLKLTCNYKFLYASLEFVCFHSQKLAVVLFTTLPIKSKELTPNQNIHLSNLCNSKLS